MILSNPVYDQLKRKTRRRNKVGSSFDPEYFLEGKELDWLFFTEFNAHENSGQSILLEE
jgi:hypothetical protein